MSSETNWRQIFVTGASVGVVVCAIYYLWKADAPRPASSSATDGGDDDQDDLVADGNLNGRHNGDNGAPARVSNTGTTTQRQRPLPGPAGPKLPPQPKRASRSSPPSDRFSSSTETEEQKRKLSELKDKSDTTSFAEVLKKESNAETTADQSAASQQTSTQEVSAGGVAEEAPEIAWSQTQEEVTIWIGISAGVKKQHIGFKLTATYIEVEVQGNQILAGNLPFPVQPDDSNWQFDTRHQQRVLAITLQKGAVAFGFPAWSELIKDAPGTSISNRAADAAGDPDILLSL